VSSESIKPAVKTFKTPKVSVIIPCHNYSQFLEECVQSLLAQSFQDWEAIIIDDGSIDSTPLVAQRLVDKNFDRLRYVHSANRGVAGARNLGIELTSAPFILPLDADDVLFPLALEKLVHRLEQDSSSGFAYGCLEFMNSLPGEPETWVPGALVKERLPVQNQVPATSLWRRKLFLEGVRYRAVIYEDWDLWLQIVAKGNDGAYTPHLIYRYRQHDAGRTRQNQNRYFLGVAQQVIGNPELYSEEFHQLAKVILAEAPRCLNLPVLAFIPPFGAIRDQRDPESLTSMARSLTQDGHLVISYGAYGTNCASELGHLRVDLPEEELLQIGLARGHLPDAYAHGLLNHLNRLGDEVVVVSGYPEILNEKIAKLSNVVGVIPYPELPLNSEGSNKVCAELKIEIQKVSSEEQKTILTVKDKRVQQFKSRATVNAILQTGRVEDCVQPSPENALSVVIAVRNPRVLALERCLQSIRQREDKKFVEIVISDFGSDPESRQCLRQLTEKYSARLIESNTRAEWSRSRALNVAIRQCNTPWVVTTDADMIFSPLLIPVWRTFRAEMGIEALYLSQTKKIVPTRFELPFPWDSKAFEEAAARARLCGTYAQGGFQCAPLEWLLRVQGFNEKFTIWGAEDEELSYRATLDGLEPIWLPPGHLLHQWHGTLVPQEPVVRNRKLFHESQILRESVVNGPNWGTISESEIEAYNLHGPLTQEPSKERTALREMERRILEESTTEEERLQLLIAWGRYALDLGQDETAFETFSDVLELAPTNIDARVGISIARLIKKDFSRASHDAAIALEIDPGNELAQSVFDACRKSA